MDMHHPPTGTYPPDEATTGLQSIPWQPPTPPPEEKPVKKVGTITVAFGLIAVGVLMILRLVVPALDYQFIARLSPLLLIAYGAEILFATAMHRDKQIKYDVVGFVVSMLLICTSLVAAAVPEVIVYGREHGAAQQRMRNELNAIGYENLKAAGIEVADLDWYIEPAYYNSWDSGTTLDDIALSDDYLQVRIRFASDFADEAAFASACRQALDAMGEFAHHADYAIFYSHNDNDQALGYGDIGSSRFELWLENTYQVNYTAAQMADEVEAYYWAGDYGWTDFQDYEEYLEWQAEEEATLDEDDDWDDDFDAYDDSFDDAA